MKKTFIFMCLLGSFFAKAFELEEAPLEVLLVQAIQAHALDRGHKSDDIVREIFNVVPYDGDKDEFILSSSIETQKLRQKLIHFLESYHKIQSLDDEYYIQWLNERKPRVEVELKAIDQKIEGLYYLNHIHTDNSTDNEDLAFLKISSEKTFYLVEKFLNQRESEGLVALTDHNMDVAYDLVHELESERLRPLRSVEWGGPIHMNLIGIMENWEFIDGSGSFTPLEMISESHSSRGFRILNHPNRKNRPFPYTDWSDVQGVEVYNTVLESAPLSLFKRLKSYNRDAFQQWVDSLKIGKHYTAFGGTDFHFVIPCFRDHSLNYPANFVVDGYQSRGRLNLDNGQIAVINRPDSPLLSLEAKPVWSETWTPMGGDISDASEVDIRLTLDFSHTQSKLGGACYNTVMTFYRLFNAWKKRQWEVRFYNLEGELVAVKNFSPTPYDESDVLAATFNLNVKASDLIRAELWEINPKKETVDLMSATQPIFFEGCAQKNCY